MVYYSHRKHLLHIERAEDDGFLESINGLQVIKRGDMLACDEFGNRFVLEEDYFYDNYVPVKKMRVTQTKRKSPFEIENAYIEMGKLVEQSNEEGQNYIFDIKK